MKTLNSILILLMTVQLVKAAPEKSLFGNPIELFSGSVHPSLTNSEKAKIVTTMRGFYLRADSSPGMAHEYEPSQLGIYLDVSVRDPEDIPVFKDMTTTEGLITTRTVEICAPINEQVALRITLAYGKDAPADTLAAIRSSISKTIEASEQTIASNRSLPLSLIAEIALDEAKRNGMTETLQNYIQHSEIVADICVYEQKWIPASEAVPKGQLIQRAVITNVHCGSWKVGQQIEYTHHIEDAPRLFSPFTSTVPGVLRTFFYTPDGSETHKEGLIEISSDGHWGFRRVDDLFTQLFAIELKKNSKLKSKSEQAAPSNGDKPSN